MAWGLTLMLAGVACGTTGTGVPGAPSQSINAQQLGESAFETTINAGTSKVAIDAVFGGSRGANLHAEGVFDYRVATGVLRFGGTGSVSNVEVRFVRAVVFAQVPSPYSRIPGVKPWVRYDIRAGAKAGYFGRLGSVTKQNPGEALTFLRGARSAEKIGPETVGNDATTRYKITVDLKQARKAAGNSSTLLSSFTEATLGDLVIDLWVDSAGRCRQVTYAVDPVTLRAAESASPDTLAMTVQYFDFGVPVDVQAPADDEVGSYFSALDAA